MIVVPIVFAREHGGGWWWLAATATAVAVALCVRAWNYSVVLEADWIIVRGLL
ncbi:hypothetical protein [Agromyces humatus]|nr:hypothetical protein [Agromyces humatus]